MNYYYLSGFVSCTCLVSLMILYSGFIVYTQEYSLRFQGTGYGDLDRVKIPIDSPHRPVDVADNFTVEFWLKAFPGENTAGTCGPGDWYYGNVVIDRDVFGDGDHGDYGIVICNRRLVVGVQRLSSTNSGVTGNIIVDDGEWHHIAVTRNSSTGGVALFVDGVLDAIQNNGPSTGNISYRDARPTSYPNSDPFLVFAAEKHDYPGSLYYKGWLDEVRISNTIRYTSNFVAPSSAFTTDANTVGLYHFNEGAGTYIGDASNASGGPSDGFIQVGGTPPGPVWSLESPFNSIREVIYNTDSGPGSLRATLDSAPSGGSVYFAPELSGQSIHITGSSLLVNKPVELAHYFSGLLTINKIGAGPCFHILDNGNHTLENLTISGGTGTNGRAVLNDGTLHLKDVVIIDIGNASGSSIQNNGQMTVANFNEIKKQ
jgi:hypothetical protein